MISNGLSTVSRSDPRFFCLPPTAQTSSAKSFKFSSVQFPSRSASLILRTLAFSEPSYPSSWSSSHAGKSFYELLGISESGTSEEIKNAYRQLARKYHPDVSPPSRVGEYTKIFIIVHEAYETLSDPRRRALYDRDIAGALYDDALNELKNAWRTHWATQLEGMSNRSSKYGDRNESWAARVRRNRDEEVLNVTVLLFINLTELKKAWRTRWATQLAGLSNRSYKYGKRNESWASRVRHNSDGVLNMTVLLLINQTELKKAWRTRWATQLAGLSNKSYKYGDRNKSWASRVRRNRDELNMTVLLFINLTELKKAWTTHWATQLAGLSNRNYKYGDQNKSWASRVRQSKDEEVLNKTYN